MLYIPLEALFMIFHIDLGNYLKFATLLTKHEVSNRRTVNIEILKLIKIL